MKMLRRLLITSLAAGMLLTGMSGPTLADALTPVVVFPAFHFTILEVKVKNQSVFPECPASGKFEDWFLNPSPNPAFNQVCRDELLTLVIDPDAAKPMAQRFSNQPGVDVKVKRYGDIESSPLYEPLYAFLEAAGYELNVNICVAGYDSRLTPDINGFLGRTMALIEETYYQNNEAPVYFELFQDANLPVVEELAGFYTGFVQFAPPFFFHVDVYAVKGSGFETVVGIELQDLPVGRVVDELTLFFTRPNGDANQEDITNDAIDVWQAMPCFRFELTDNVGVDRFALASDAAVLQQLLTNLQRAKSVCL